VESKGSHGNARKARKFGWIGYERSPLRDASIGESYKLQVASGKVGCSFFPLSTCHLPLATTYIAERGGLRSQAISGKTISVLSVAFRG
jgi:hypothetical protein